jgi:hypothetical protein
MEDFALEGLRELYRQEKKKLEELESKEIEKALCDAGIELLKDIKLSDDNPALTRVAEEKHREFSEKRKKARSIVSEKYLLQKSLVSKIESRLDTQYGLVSEVTSQGEILFRKKDTI